MCLEPVFENLLSLDEYHIYLDENKTAIISYERINEVAIDKNKDIRQEKENQLSTLAILKEIERTKGEFDLF